LSLFYCFLIFCDSLVDFGFSNKKKVKRKEEEKPITQNLKDASGDFRNAVDSKNVLQTKRARLRRFHCVPAPNKRGVFALFFVLFVFDSIETRKQKTVEVQKKKNNQQNRPSVGGNQTSKKKEEKNPKKSFEIERRYSISQKNKSASVEARQDGATNKKIKREQQRKKEITSTYFHFPQFSLVESNQQKRANRHKTKSIVRLPPEKEEGNSFLVEIAINNRRSSLVWVTCSCDNLPVHGLCVLSTRRTADTYNKGDYDGLSLHKAKRLTGRIFSMGKEQRKKCNNFLFLASFRVTDSFELRNIPSFFKCFLVDFVASLSR